MALGPAGCCRASGAEMAWNARHDATRFAGSSPRPPNPNANAAATPLAKTLAAVAWGEVHTGKGERKGWAPARGVAAVRG